jgi:hypothetical protein
LETTVTDEFPSVDRAISRFDNPAASVNEHDVHAELMKVRKHYDETQTSVSFELQSELMAFAFCERYRKNNESGWGLYYGPMVVFQNEKGEMVEAPRLEEVTAEVIDYWSQRARQSVNPILRNRYADVCWEFSRSACGRKRQLEMAHIAIDAAVSAARSGCYSHEMYAWRKLERALTLAITIHDSCRIDAVREQICAYEKATAVDNALGSWGHAAGLLLNNSEILLPLSVEQELISDLEARLSRLLILKSREQGPFAVERAALLLAKYYRAKKQKADCERVMHAHGALVLELAKSGGAMIGSSWLTKLQSLYREFSMAEDAEKTLVLLREISLGAQKEMVSHREEIKVPNEEMQGFINELMGKNLSDCLARIAIHFVPKRDHLIEQLNEMAAHAPIHAMVPISIMDHEGRQIATIGSLKNDLDGRVIHCMAQNMAFSQIFLSRSIEAGLEKYAAEPESIMRYLQESPVFTDSHCELLRAGISAYLRRDYIAAISILTPRVEGAIRNLLNLCGGSGLKPHPRGGGLLFVGLEALLHDPIIIRVLTRDIVDYLRTLLTDQRGWNLRNDLCHGIMLPSSFSVQSADRILHALLLLALVKSQTK